MATHSFTRGNLGCLLFMQYKNNKKTPRQNNLKPQKELCGMEQDGTVSKWCCGTNSAAK